MATVSTTVITTALTASASTPINPGVSGASALILTDFVYGSGGTTFSVWVQTSLDGVVWIDVCNMSGTTASMSRVQNISSRTVITSPYTVTDGTLTANTVHDGIVGALWRTKITTTGTYAGASTLTVTVLPGQ